jgi:hypothetical protein
MAHVILVDTSVFLNILNVPAFNQNRSDVFDQLRIYLSEQSTSLILPMVAIIEAGNHIAQLSSGGDRRKFASIFAEEVQKAIAGQAPWQAMRMPDMEKIRDWLPEFPDYAMREVGMGDLAIINDWKDACELYTAYRVSIWSLDHAFAGCDRASTI